MSRKLFTYEENLAHRLAGLLHDPPDKQASLPAHEKRARRLCERIKHVLQRLKGDQIGRLLDCRNLHGEYSVARTADRLASSFDRLLFFTSSFRVSHFDVFVNIFDPTLAREQSSLPYKNALNKHLKELYDAFEISLWRLAQSAGVKDGLDFYHVFSTVYEPLWNETVKKVTGRDPIPMPADTRLPHHTVFDHLHASAAIAGIVANKTGGMSAAVVYIELPGFYEWIQGARRLSDLWAAAWIGVSLLWYMVKEIVWAFGPDTLLYPSPRWNPFYYALLHEKLGLNKRGSNGGPTLEEKLEEWFYWQGAPVYAWYPPFTMLLIPTPESVDFTKSQAKDLVNPKLVKVYKHRGRQYTVSEEFIKELKKYLYERFNEAWDSVLEAVTSQLNEGCNDGEDKTRKYDIKNILMNLKSKPPFNPIIVVGTFYWRADSKLTAVKARVEKTIAYYCTGEDDDCEQVYISLFKDKLDNIEASDEIIELFRRKMLYATVFPMILEGRRRALRKIAPVRTGWALHPDTVNLHSNDSSECETKKWRSCTVCRSAPAVLHVPGRDLKGGGVSESYKRFARCAAKALKIEDRSEEAWRAVRPLFRPGERLCPYCLVKRLVGLPDFFREASRRLYGYWPESVEARFPSTDDIASLGTKLALLEASLIDDESSGDRNLERRWEELARQVGLCAKGLARSESLRKLAELVAGDPDASSLRERDLDARDKDVIKNVIYRRIWVPWLLGKAVRRAWEKATSKCERSEEAGDCRKLWRTALAVLVAAMEFWDLFDPERCGNALKALRKLGDEISNLGEPRFRELGEALARPRIYYGILAIHVHDIRRLYMGALVDSIKSRENDLPSGYSHPDAEKAALVRSNVLYQEEYLKRVIDHVVSSCFSPSRRGQLPNANLCRIPKTVCSNMMDLERLKECIMNYIKSIKTKNIDNNSILNAVNEVLGVIAVSPAFHYALSHAISTMNGRIIEQALLMGGVPVHVGGEDAVILLPAWLPSRSLTITGEQEQQQLPAAETAYMAPALVWGGRDGFHPDKSLLGRPVPGLVNSPVGIILRLAHYMDHLNSELSGALAASRASSMAGAWGSLVVSMGRTSPHSVQRAILGTPRLLLDRNGVLTGAHTPLYAGLRLVESAIAARISRQGLRSLDELSSWLERHLGDTLKSESGRYRNRLLWLAWRLFQHETERHSGEYSLYLQDVVEKLVGSLEAISQGESPSAEIRAALSILAAATRTTGGRGSTEG